MSIRRLIPFDAAALQALRLTALRECSSAFSSSYEEECDIPLVSIEARLAPASGRITFGAFVESGLVGMVGVGREDARKLKHKAFIRSMYVAADHRGKSVGRKLLAEAMAFAARMEGVQRITLAVTAGNAAALALYEAMGFVVYGREPQAMLVDGVLYDELLMSHELE